ncbi:P-loop containing nucleoside triphosphate hydrolase protein [Lentinula raphanica]|nr:P-loop containing nucleoside triphosphate hydrolase protein [Lentinula raphanica]
MAHCTSLKSDEDVRNQAFVIFGRYPCLWQIKAARAISEGKDVLTIAPTGAGKTFAYWLSLVFAEKGTVIVVTPLKELGAQFEAELNGSVGCAALNITARNSTDEVYKDIAKLKYRVVIFSPETMAKDPRYDVLLHNRVFMCSVITIVIDETHVIREWGGTFRPEYHALGPSRYALPRHIPYHLGTATLPPTDAAQLKEHLNLGTNMMEIRLDTDRRNIFHRVVKMKHPMNSYHSLAPLIPQNSNASKPKKFLVFFNSRNAAQEGARFLRSRLPESEVEQVKWIHSGMTDEFRHDEVHALKVGDRLGACATDAVGMGIDIPDIYTVIQYGVPVSLSAWYQRLGRAVRDLTLDGCAILLAEPCHFDNVKHAAAKIAKETAERNTLVKQLAETAAAEAREIQRASIIPVTANASQPEKRELDNQESSHCRKRNRFHAPVEPDLLKTQTLDFNGYEIKIERSMDDYINAENRPGKKCRREIGCIYFGNVGLEPVVNQFCCTRSGCSPCPVKHCCDLCEPEYWPFTTAETFTIKKPRMSNPKTYKQGEKEKTLWQVLDHERDRWFMEKYGKYALITPTAFWPDSILDRIVAWAHENKLLHMDDFHKRMSWAYTDELGPRILQLIKENYHYDPPIPKPRRPRHSLASLASNTPNVPPMRTFGAAVSNIGSAQPQSLITLATPSTSVTRAAPGLASSVSASSASTLPAFALTLPVFAPMLPAFASTLPTSSADASVIPLTSAVAVTADNATGLSGTERVKRKYTQVTCSICHQKGH